MKAVLSPLLRSIQLLLALLLTHAVWFPTQTLHATQSCYYYNPSQGYASNDACCQDNNFEYVYYPAPVYYPTEQNCCSNNCIGWCAALIGLAALVGAVGWGCCHKDKGVRNEINTNVGSGTASSGNGGPIRHLRWYR